MVTTLNRETKVALKSLVTVSTMTAIYNFISESSPLGRGATLVRLLSNVGALSIGYVLGDVISDEIIDSIDIFLAKRGA